MKNNFRKLLVRPKIILLFCLLFVSVITVVMLLWPSIDLSGNFDPKSSRTQKVTFFTKHEPEFRSLIAYYDSISPKGGSDRIMFGKGTVKQVHLKTVMNVVSTSAGSSVNEISEFDIGSLSLKSKLDKIGWSINDVEVLLELLRKVNCEWIRTTESLGEPIEIYCGSEGWGSYSYFVFRGPVSTEVQEIFGAPISSSEFGSRVFLQYSSAL